MGAAVRGGPGRARHGGGDERRPGARPPERGAAVLSAVDVDLWLASSEVPDAVVARCAALMDDGERRRAEALRAPGSRRLHVLARALVRTTLSSYCDVAPDRWRFAPDPGGKPRISGPPDRPDLRFSLSHTEGLLALAVARNRDVGVDVERLDPHADVEGLAEVALAPSERDALRAAPPEERAATFVRLWTAKEAFLKAQGLGLGAVDPRAIAFDADASPPRLARPAGAGPWRFHALRPTAAHIATLAVPAASIALRVVWATPGCRVTPPSGSRLAPGLCGRTPSRRAS